MKKRGQGVFGMSFSMIFSIIIIIAILATGFYVISYFLNLSKCTDTGILFDSLQKEVDRAWRSTIYGDIFELGTPKGVSHVCFGSLSSDAGTDNSKRNEIIDYGNPRNPDNFYLYPPRESCSSDLYSYNIEHVEIEGFFCVSSKDGSAEIRISKDNFDSLVSVTK